MKLVNDFGMNIKKLNNRPIWLGIGVVTLIGLSMIWGINSRTSKNDENVTEDKKEITNSSDKAVDGILSNLIGKQDTNASDINMSDINNTLNNSNVQSQRRYDNNVSMGTEMSPLDQAAQAAFAEQLKRNIDAKNAPTKQGSSGSLGVGDGISGLLAGLTGGGASSSVGMTNPTNAINEAMKNLITNNGGGGAKSNNKESNDFLKSTVNNSDYLQHNKTPQLSPYELKTGSVIPGVLISGINSQLPGMIIGQVSDNVYDSATGRHLLIPQGTRLVGTYSADVNFGQNRALIAWNRLVFQNGDTLNIEAMNGTDQAGYAGFADKVNNHYFRIFGSALLISMIGGEISFSNGRFSVNQQAASTQGQTTISQTGNTMLNKNLEVAPTIEIRPGYRFNIFITKDISFKK